jgi:hypothetical protein
MNLNLIDMFRRRLISPSCRKSCREDGYWKVSTEEVENTTLIAHFQEAGVFGQVFDSSCRKYFCLDFDRQQAQTKENYRKLITHVRALIQAPSLLLQSSESKSCHCYFFIKPEDSSLVYNRVVGALQADGINPKPGFLEVFARSGQNLRLPFGKGSSLLGEDFKKLNISKEEQILLFSNQLAERNLPSIYFATPGYKYHPSSALDHYLYEVDVKELMKNGLRQDGERNDAVMAYAIYKAKSGCTFEEANKEIQEWFLYGHNGNSKDFLSNPIKTCARIEQTVQWAFDKNFSKTITPTKLDVQPVDFEVCDFLFEQFHGRYTYSVEKAIFKMVQFIKKKKLANNRPFSMSFKLLKDSFGLHDRCRKYVLQDLYDLGVLKLVKQGRNIMNNSSGHASLFTWTGPQFVRDQGCRAWSDYLVKKKYNTKECYSPSMLARIREDMAHEYSSKN